VDIGTASITCCDMLCVVECRFVKHRQVIDESLRFGGEKLFPRNNLRFGRLHGGEEFETPVRSGYRYGIDSLL